MRIIEKFDWFVIKNPPFSLNPQNRKSCLWCYACNVYWLRLG